MLVYFLAIKIFHYSLLGVFHCGIFHSYMNIFVSLDFTITVFIPITLLDCNRFTSSMIFISLVYNHIAMFLFGLPLFSYTTIIRNRVLIFHALVTFK